MIQPRFTPSAERFLDSLPSNDARRAVIEFIVDEVCPNPYLEPDDPDSKKHVYYSMLPAVFTVYEGDDWWVRYRIVEYRDPPLGTVLDVAAIGAMPR